MTWNWERKDWPQFSYNTNRLAAYEKQFVHNAGLMGGSMRHISTPDQETLTIELISNEAYKTSEIEGELLDRESLQSSIKKNFGLKSDQKKIPFAEQGIAEMMVDLYQQYQNPLDHTRLFKWHKMLTKGRRDLKNIGAYRTHEEPMQIVSGAIYKPKIHYEAPPSKKVQKEMDRFIEWFNQTGPQGKLPLDALIRAGIAHLYFESIHPFEDGNGRIGRAISEKALSESLGRPTLIAISYTIESEKKEYYSALERNSKSMEVTDWMIYFCEMILRAQHHTQSMIDFTIEKSKFYHRFANTLNERQAQVIKRIFREGIKGFEGGLSANNYIKITGTTASTATRDLQDLVEQGALIKIGERKGTRYYLNIDHGSVKGMSS